MTSPTSIRALLGKPYEMLVALDKRGREVNATPGESADVDREWVGVAWRMAGEAYLVAREETREVLPYPTQLTRVPGAKNWVKGLANVRGALLPVIDLRGYLGSGATPLTRNTRVLVVNHRDVPAGLMVDEVLGFRRFTDGEFSADAPPTIVRCERYVAGAFRRGTDAWPVLNLRQLVENPGSSMQQPEGTTQASKPRGQGWILLGVVIAIVAAGLSFYNGGLYGMIAGVTALAVLVPLSMLFLSVRSTMDETRVARSAMEAQKREGERNQAAILRLLDEIAGLGQGDLTATATVTEDITGAIADSVNIAVESLRGLVTTINQSSEQLDGTARQTQALAQHLAKSSSAQSRQIAAATESISSMAGSIEEVSGNAERASDVARHSVDIAHKGGEAVRRTIDGMNAIRETIQETSKRIKRLGESSQEIGNIVEVINDLAEQTNILALNASIQASMAGEAGRGFAVVADEVQRLAERAGAATKQIDALVRTIQTDTNGAVVSMERSTADVVGGATLAENAGSALEKIEQVSNQIASLVQNISASARSQSQSSQSVARNMQVLREISTQTADATSNTSDAIAKLAQLSAALRKSVAGFRLPDAPASTTQRIPAPDPSSSGRFRRVASKANG